MRWLTENSLVQWHPSRDLGTRMGGKPVPRHTYSINQKIPARVNHITRQRRSGGRKGTKISMRILLRSWKHPSAFDPECAAYQRLVAPLSCVASPMSVDSCSTFVSRSSAAPSSACLFDLFGIISTTNRPQVSRQGHANQFMVSFRVSFACDSFL